MPYTCTIDDDGTLAYLAYSGDLAAAEVKASLLDLTGDSRFASHLDVLADLRASVLTSPHADLTVLAYLLDTFAGPDGRTALLVDPTCGCGTALQPREVVQEPRDTRVFTASEAALTWLKGD
jgi:hypothetical protein